MHEFCKNHDVQIYQGRGSSTSGECVSEKKI